MKFTANETGGNFSDTNYVSAFFAQYEFMEDSFTSSQVSILSAIDYSPFGAQLPGRKFSNLGYSFLGLTLKKKIIKPRVMEMPMILEPGFMMRGLRDTRLLNLDSTDKYKLSVSIFKSSNLLANQ